ncbi:hypothetical protein GCM10027277_53140 [Pseudoduganella ginsengisoli]|uniref:Twin-arginine translocation signal domain-containing protein n=1 Tax=Pseudoduganella ginsengisoli TaxID=1462440 RepID=A0A6L6Q244_9BURK|nr:hypothetical protein [Pseudoduganella ginsengisoli]MTW03308.1 hypothetical protein [Pseudoduganella ginsengisoli]
MTNRRTFLKAGVLGALVLAAGGAVYRKVQGPPALAPYRLDGGARTVLTAIVPAILGPMLPAGGADRAAAIARTVDGVQGAVATLPLVTQKEIQDLFGLLSLAPARRLLAGVPAWEEASADQVSAFLQGWRTHRLGLLRGAYAALHDLVLGAWYAQPDAWAAIGYPGPIKELS